MSPTHLSELDDVVALIGGLAPTAKDLRSYRSWLQVEGVKREFALMHLYFLAFFGALALR